MVTAVSAAECGDARSFPVEGQQAVAALGHPQLWAAQREPNFSVGTSFWQRCAHMAAVKLVHDALCQAHLIRLEKCIVRIVRAGQLPARLAVAKVRAQGLAGAFQLRRPTVAAEAQRRRWQRAGRSGRQRRRRRRHLWGFVGCLPLLRVADEALPAPVHVASSEGQQEDIMVT